MNPVIITGATGSIGGVVARALAMEGTPLILACRNLEKGSRLREKLLSEVHGSSIELLELDLSRRESVRTFTTALSGRKIAGLFNNAGTMARRYSLTGDGLEEDMAVNFVNTALLTMGLLPCMEDGGRIVCMGSLTSKIFNISPDWRQEGEKQFGQLRTYGKSKQALLYFTIALARRNPRLHINVSDPGVVDSKMITMDRWFDPLADVLFRPFINSPEKGARSAIAALHSEESLNYHIGLHHDPIPGRFLRSDMPDRLWEQLNSIILQGK